MPGGVSAMETTKAEVSGMKIYSRVDLEILS